MTRRALLAALAAPAAKTIRLHVGNYGLQSLTVDAAIEQVRRIGYDGIELCAMPEWPSDPQKLSAADRRRIRESRFPVPTIIESFNLLAAEEAHRKMIDRLKAAAALAHDIDSRNPPLIQTVLGGRPADWPAVRDRMASRLEEWGRAAQANRVKLAVKAHAMQAVDTPEKLIGLLDQVRQPALTAIYDYGHFQVRDLPIESTMDQLLPRSAFITVKDSKVADGEVRFLLPGDGTIDYKRYFEKVRAMRWSGWVLVEITRQLQTMPGYDGVKACRRSYAHLAPILRAAGLR